MEHIYVHIDLCVVHMKLYIYLNKSNEMRIREMLLYVYSIGNAINLNGTVCHLNMIFVVFCFWCSFFEDDKLVKELISFYPICERQEHRHSALSLSDKCDALFTTVETINILYIYLSKKLVKERRKNDNNKKMELMSSELTFIQFNLFYFTNLFRIYFRIEIHSMKVCFGKLLSVVKHRERYGI